MDEYIKCGMGLLVVVSPLMRWLLMKKDHELPWVVRIARWAAVAFGIAYGILLIIEKAKAVL